MPEIAAAEVELMRLIAFCRPYTNGVLLNTGQLRLQLGGNCSGYFGFDRKNIGKLSIVRFRPEMGSGRRFDQLHGDPCLISHALDASLENLSDAELVREFRQIVRI